MKTPVDSQLSLTGINAPTEEYSLFFALFPDAQTAGVLTGVAQLLAQKYRLKSVLRPENHFHVSLYHLGNYEEVPGSVIAMARQAAESVKIVPFDIAFDRARSFPNKQPKKPLVLAASEENIALTTFQRTLGQALTLAGLGRWVKTAGTPHLTLFYDNTILAEEHISTITWNVQQFVLVRSLVNQTHYERLESWPLRGPFA